MTKDNVFRNVDEVWVVKYALTDGIAYYKANQITSIEYDEKYVVVSKDTMRLWLGKGEYAFSEEEAMALAHKKRLRKIDSLKKSLNKTMDMTFKIKKKE